MSTMRDAMNRMFEETLEEAAPKEREMLWQ